MSFALPARRKRLSCQATNTLPAPSISAVGSGPERRPPATVWERIRAIVVTSDQLAPPLVERNAPTAVSLALSIGTITLPFGSITGWPPRPAWRLGVVILAPQVSPPSVDVLIWIRLPWALLSHSV